MSLNGRAFAAAAVACALASGCSGSARHPGMQQPILFAASLSGASSLSPAGRPQTHTGVIVGHVLDENGAPRAGALVDALVSRMEDGQPALVRVANATTDDRGGFTLTRLPAGHYYVSASDPAFAIAGEAPGTPRYTPTTYYPGVLLVEEATRIRVSPGAEPTGKLVLTLRNARPATVSGRLTTADGRELVSGTVIMAALRGDGFAPVAPHDVVIHADGTFTFRNVPPGRYQIRGRGEVTARAGPRVATLVVSVQGHDIGNLELVLRPAATVEGTIVAEAVAVPKPPDLTGLRVRATFVDRSGIDLSVAENVAPNGSYHLSGLLPGLHDIAVDGLAPPWVLKSVTYRGQNVADAGLDVASDQHVKDLRITLTDAATEVAGRVTDGSGRPAGGALVLAIPAPQFWRRTSRRFAVLRSDAEGLYRIRGLPPGEYRLVATLEADESELYRVDVLQELSAAGVSVKLADRQRQPIDLTLAGTPAGGRTAAR